MGRHSAKKAPNFTPPSVPWATAHDRKVEAVAMPLIGCSLEKSGGNMRTNKLMALGAAGILAASLGACSVPNPEAPASTPSQEEAAPAATEDETQEPAQEETQEPTQEETQEETEEAEEPVAPEETVAQANARESAESYISFSGFSRTGLIEQLEFEGYSNEDATYAVDVLEVDWNEQAARSAESYLEFSSFSRQGLIDQLMYEGYTQEQAEHGANSVGL